MNIELGTRIPNGGRAFWRLKSIWDSNMNIGLKTKVLESNVAPVLTYGAQIWAITKSQTHKIKTSYYAMLRKILQMKLKDKIR